MARGIVLEETYQKWIRYKDDCIEMIENEPLSLGISFRLMLKDTVMFSHAGMMIFGFHHRWTLLQ